MISSAKRGTFIVIEGLDRSGKSTQSSAILARLQTLDIAAKLIKFPGMSERSDRPTLTIKTQTAQPPSEK